MMTPRINERQGRQLGVRYWIQLQYRGEGNPSVRFAEASAALQEEGFEPIASDSEDERLGNVPIDPVAATGIAGSGEADNAYRPWRAIERVRAIVAEKGIELEAPLEAATLRELPSLPLYVAVHAGCNLACWYCTEHGENRAFGPPLLPTPRLIEILEEAHACGTSVFRFTGGEPTLRRDLPEIMEAAQDLGEDVQIAITTNGVRLGGMLDTLARLNRPRVFLSVDGLKGFSADHQPSDSDFQISKWLTPDLLELVDELRSVAEVRLNYVLTRTSLDQVWDLIDFAAERGLDVKLFELLQRDFIKTGGRSKREAFEAQYVPIRQLVPDLVERFGEPEPFRGLGGRGIPMMSVSTGSSRIVYFDSLAGSHYSERACGSCRHFPCQEGLYAPVLNASGTLHPAGCMNRGLYRDVAKAEEGGAMVSLEQLRNEICRSRLKPDVPASLSLISAGA